MLIVTKELIDEGLSINGALNGAQVKVLMPNEKLYCGFPRSGWRKRLLGTKVTQSQVDEFLRLKNRHLAHKTRKLPPEKPLYKEIYSHMDSIRQEIKESKTEKYDCSTCIHGLTNSCTDRPDGGCTYYYNAKTDEHGPAYAA
ncbi:MAG: hypothetical protein IMZ70_07810 [Candidatus Atribacteria bacterium]|nr:hypothetical protein [Candidatus Atribacteria bacterium]MBE3145039.1 hypothetical protein [Planctomycetota bacterium]